MHACVYPLGCVFFCVSSALKGLAFVHMFPSDRTRAARLRAAATVGPLYQLSLPQRAQAVAEIIRETHGRAVTTVKTRCDRRWLELSACVKGAAVRGLDRDEHAYVCAVCDMALNAPQAGIRQRVSHDLELMYRATREHADVAQEAAVARARRRRLNHWCGTAIALMICWFAATSCLRFLQRPSLTSAGLAASWVATVLGYSVVARRSA